MNKKIKKTDTIFLKNVLFLSGGTVVSQAIIFLLSPFITRIYSPEEYGILTIFISILSLFAGSESLRYELAIPVAENDEDAINLLALCIMILSSISLIILLIMLICGNSIFKILPTPSIYKYRILIPIEVFLYGVYQILMRWNLRQRNYSVISITKVMQSISSNAIKIIFGILNFGALGLILGKIMGESAGILKLGKTLTKNKLNLFRVLSIRKIKYLSRRYIKFPLFSLPSNLLSRFANQIPTLFFAIYFGSEVVGIYGFTLGVINLPVSVIGISIGDVFYSEAATIGKKNAGEIIKLSNELFKKLILFGLLPLICLVFFAPYLFEFVFGGSWAKAGEYAQVLSFLGFSQLIFQPVSRIYDIFDKQNELLFFTILRIILVVISFFISQQLSFEPKQSLILYVIVMFLIHGIIYVNGQRILKNSLPS